MKNLGVQKSNSLPTQLSQPQWWEEGGKLSLLPLREAAPIVPPVQKERLAPAEPQGSEHSLKSQFALLVVLSVLSVLGYYLVSRFIATTVIVKGRSMTPTLQDGDRFILNRLSYFRRPPHRGEVVVVKDPGHNDYAVKRVIGVPGESILFKHGDVLVNGKPLPEPYLAAGTETYLPDSAEKLIITGKDQYLVLGDNRANSEDSRFYGALHRNQIVGSISR